MVTKAHPKLYQFVRATQNKENVIKVELQQLALGVHESRRTLSTINKEHKITELKTHSLGNIISLEDYISRYQTQYLILYKYASIGLYFSLLGKSYRLTKEGNICNYMI